MPPNLFYTFICRANDALLILGTKCAYLLAVKAQKVLEIGFIRQLFHRPDLNS